MPLLKSKLLKECVADVQPIVPYVGRWLLDFAADIGAVLICPLSLIFRGMFAGSVVNVGRQIFITLLRYPAQLMLTVGSLLLNALASFINNAFLHSYERSLNQQELQYLQPIFGSNLDYAAIKIQAGGIKEKLKISPQAVGSDIFLRHFWGAEIIDNNLSLTPAGFRLLGHEACHVWQFQHKGAGYIGDSLITQMSDILGRRIGIRLSDGYDLHAALRAKRNCNECNVEQQAVMAELIGVACSLDESAELTCDAFNRAITVHLDAAEFTLVQNAHEWLKGAHKH